MKRKIYLFLIFIPLLLQSCLFENDESFDTSASARVSKLVADTRTILEEQSNGWVMRYFPGANLGGYNLVITFNNGTATVACETASEDYTEECLYDIIKEDGAVLSFNTYSELIHQFHEPSGNNVDGIGGDYEFRILSADENRVRMQGKLHGVAVDLIPLPEEYTAATYLAAIKDAQSKSSGDFRVYSIDNQRLATTVGARQGRYMMFTVNDQSADLKTDDFNMSAVYTPNGIIFYNELNIGGFHGQEFVLSGDEYVATDGDMKLLLSNDKVLSYDEILGEWDLDFYMDFARTYPFSTSVEFTVLEQGKSYTAMFTGLASPLSCTVQYESGRLSFNPQYVGMYRGEYCWLLFVDTELGRGYWGSSMLMTGRYSERDGYDYITVSDCCSMVDAKFDAMMFYSFSNKEATSGSMIRALMVMADPVFKRAQK